MIINNIDIYTEKTLEKKFAYRYFGLQNTLKIGNIITFIAPVKIRIEDSFVSSDQAFNFCIELPNYSCTSGILFQKIFNISVANLLSKEYIKTPVELSGSDIIILKEHNQGGIIQKNGIVSLNQVFYKNETILIYLGLHNVAGEGAHARSFSLKLDSEQGNKFMQDIIKIFYDLANEVFLQTSKYLL